MVKILISTPLRWPAWFINLLAPVLAFAATTLPTAQSLAAQPVYPPACLSKTPVQQHDVSERAALFKSGVGLYVSTSIVSVSNPTGLAQAAVLTEQLRDYARARGLSIDWSRPTTNTEVAHTIQEYQDPDPGLNGIVRLRHDRDGRRVAMSLSVAP